MPRQRVLREEEVPVPDQAPRVRNPKATLGAVELSGVSDLLHAGQRAQLQRARGKDEPRCEGGCKELDVSSRTGAGLHHRPRRHWLRQSRPGVFEGRIITRTAGIQLTHAGRHCKLLRCRQVINAIRIDFN